MAKSKNADVQKSNIIKVNFIDPTGGKIIEASLDSTLTPNEIIIKLIAATLVPNRPSPGYGMAAKGGPLLLPNESLHKSSVKSGDDLQIISWTDAE